MTTLTTTQKQTLRASYLQQSRPPAARCCSLAGVSYRAGLRYLRGLNPGLVALARSL